jgi:hypothetical protein
VVGLSKFDGKDKRRQRRAYQRNHIAQDLASPKYRQQVKAAKRAEDDYDDVNYYWQEDEDDNG